MSPAAPQTADHPSWRNWSGSVQASPTTIARPSSEAELAQVIRHAGKVRVVGSGHSFMPLCATDGVLVSLDELRGQLTVADDRQSAWAPAGWTLRRVTEALWAEGLSLANQGDIDAQTLAGAVGTGTHGTGGDLGSLSSQTLGFRVMGPDGTVTACDADQAPELFRASQISLGLLGVATEVRMAVLPAYHLQERVEKQSFEAVLEGFADGALAHRHAEFFVFPYADSAMMKYLQPAQDEGAFKEPRPVDETVFRLACELGAAANGFIPTLQKLLTRGSGKSTRTGPAWRIFPSERTIPFEEMEYELPREAGLPVLKELIDWIRRRELPVSFPFEFRWTASDDLWISPFNKGPCASISMHQFAPMPWRELFREAEAVLRANGGRPHWGKRHTLTRDDVDALYPMAERFRAVRRGQDGQGKFLNAHLGELFS